MIRKVSLLLVVIILILGTYSAQAQREKIRIAIMDLQPRNVDEVTAKTVSDLLRTELHNTGLFRVIERGEMNAILKEQEFQQSGCTETECAVEMGRLLSAKKILIGTINKLGTKYIINARIVDVERGEMEFADKAVTKSEEDLDIAVEEFARKISRRIRSGTPIPKKTKRVKKAKEPKPARPPAPPGSIRHAGLRSAALPGWGQIYSGHSLEGYVNIGAMVISAGMLGYSWMDYNTKLKDYEDLEEDLDKEEYKKAYNTANDAYKFRNAMIFTTALVWGFNIINASLDEVIARSESESSTAINGKWVLGAGWRSALLPGWGQLYAGHKTEGYISMGAVAVSGGMLAFSWMDYNKKLKEYEDLEEGLDKEEYKKKYDAANDAYKFRNTMIAVLATAYGFNILDALLDGVFYNSEEGASGLNGRTALSTGLRSAALPGWGQIRTGYKIKGYIYLGATLVSGGILALKWMDYSKKLKDYDDLEEGLTEEEYKKAYNTANDAFKSKNTMLYATIAIYSVNVIDALFCGTYSQIGSSTSSINSQSQQAMSFGFDGDTARLGLAQAF